MTLVNLNGETSGSNPFETGSGQSAASEIKHVHHHHFVTPGGELLESHPFEWHRGPTQVGANQGSQTLPHRGSKKHRDRTRLSADDSDVIIRRHGVNGVKIQINNSVNANANANLNSTNNSNGIVEKEVQTSLEFQYPSDNSTNNKVNNNNNNNSGSSVTSSSKRKYTLEELEVEGFEPSTSGESQKDPSEILEDIEADEVDLNSLIEGDVDDLDEDDLSTPLGRTIITV